MHSPNSTPLPELDIVLTYWDTFLPGDWPDQKNVLSTKSPSSLDVVHTNIETPNEDPL